MCLVVKTNGYGVCSEAGNCKVEAANYALVPKFAVMDKQITRPLDLSLSSVCKMAMITLQGCFESVFVRHLSSSCKGDTEMVMVSLGRILD